MKRGKERKLFAIFLALTELYCSYNYLISLDVSKNTILKELDCSDNNLTSLDMGKNTRLYMLLCDNNCLTDLDLSKNTELGILRCSGNELTSLDLKNVPSYIYTQLDNNTYDIEVDQINLKFDLDSMPGNFDPSSASDWIGGYRCSKSRRLCSLYLSEQSGEDLDRRFGICRAEL